MKAFFRSPLTGAGLAGWNLELALSALVRGQYLMALLFLIVGASMVYLARERQSEVLLDERLTAVDRFVDTRARGRL